MTERRDLQRPCCVYPKSWWIFLAILTGMGVILQPVKAEPVDLEELALKAGLETDGRRVPARFGRGFRFSADHQPLVLPRGFAVEKGFTFETWFLIEENQPKTTIFSASAWANCQLVIHNNEQIIFSYRRGRLSTIHPLQTHRWYHLAVRLEPGKQVTLFLDGQIIAHREEEVPAPHAGSNIRVLGGWRISENRPTRNHLRGVLDRPRFWSRILEDHEMEASFRQGHEHATIIPPPQQVLRKGEGAFTAKDRIDLRIDSALISSDHFSVAAVSEALQKSFPGVRINTLDSRGDFRQPTLAVVRPTAANRKHYLNLSDEPWDALPPEGYALRIQRDRIVILADDASGAQNGLMSLKQLIEQRDLAAMAIWDYPTYPYRGGMLVDDSQPPYRFTSDHRKLIDRMAELKQRQFMLRSHSWVCLDDPQTLDRIERLVDYARDRGIEVTPYIQAYSHAKGFLWRDLKTGHTTAVDKEQGTFANDDLLELQKRNVIVHETSPLEVRWNERAMEEGRDYEIVPGVTKAQWSGHPEGTRYTWAFPHVPQENEAWRLRRLAGGRIPAGGHVSISYAHASGQQCTCPFSPATWTHLEDAVRRSLAVTQASYINLGMDEVWVIRHPECRACQQNPLSPEETLIDAMNRAARIAKEIDPNVTVILWADMLDEFFVPNWTVPLDGAVLDELFRQGRLSKDVILVPWQYSGGVTDKRRALQYLQDRGFPTLGAATFTFDNNLIWSEAALRVQPASEQIKGVLFCTWDSRRFDQWDVGIEGHAMANWSPHRISLPRSYELLQKAPSTGDLSGSMEKIDRLQLQLLYAQAQKELEQVGPWLSQHVRGLVDLKSRIDQIGEQLR